MLKPGIGLEAKRYIGSPYQAIEKISLICLNTYLNNRPHLKDFEFRVFLTDLHHFSIPLQLVDAIIYLEAIPCLTPQFALRCAP